MSLSSSAIPHESSEVNCGDAGGRKLSAARENWIWI
jgi:hypothetical protein